jgi:NitT/TauT family transport system permease protein
VTLAVKTRGRARESLNSIIVPVVIILLWEVTADLRLIPVAWVPAPSTVARTFYIWIFGGGAALSLASGTWVTDIVISGVTVVWGFLIAVVAGVLFGLLIGWFKLAESLAEPLMNILRPIPITAWVPFAVVAFGIRAPSAIFLIALGAFFPIAINTYDGVKQTPLMLKRAALMLGASTRSLFFNVALRSALPNIFTGLRLGVGLAWVLVVVAEMLAVQEGLGFVLWDAYNLIRMDLIIADMLTVGCLGFLSDRAITMIGDYFLRWTKGVVVG